MYALIHNGQIQVGPRIWLYSAFKEYLEDNQIDYAAISRLAPEEPIVTPEFSILPVKIVDAVFDSVYEQPVGPFLTIHEDSVTGSYGKQDKDIEIVKGLLKQKVAGTRYTQEIAGTSVTLQGQSVKLYTNREDRSTYLDAFLLAQENTVYNFKFPLSGNLFLSITKSDLQAIVMAVASHVQLAFVWEASKSLEIDSKSTFEELKSVDLVPA